MKRGASLMEAIVSIFLLLISFLIVINLFHSGLNHTPRIENQQLAALVMERHVEQMRIWSSTLNGNVYNFDNPGLATIYNGTTVPAVDYGQMLLSTNVTNTTVYSPCSQLELGVVSVPPFVQPRKLDQHLKKVQVTVRWDNGARQLSMATLFARPALFFRPVAAINVTVGGATSLAANESTTFTAVGYDSNNNPISNLFFVWDICPVNASGTLVQARDGTIANLTNRIYAPPNTAAQTPPFSGTPTSSVGQLYVRATAKYHGETVSANSTVITLTP